MNLRRCFAGVNPGDRCTGTVHFYGLNSTALLDRKVIRLSEDGRDYYLVRVPSKWSGQ